MAVQIPSHFELHRQATKEWVEEVFGQYRACQTFSRGQWIPGIFINGEMIILRPYADRRDFLDVWRALGGAGIPQEKLAKASVHK